MTHQVIEVSTPNHKGEKTLPGDELQMNLYESKSEGEDPMVSGTISHVSAQVEIVVPSLGTRGMVKALIGSSCMRCLIIFQTVRNLGLQVRKFHQPLKLEQVDGSMIGGLPASYLCLCF